MRFKRWFIIAGGTVGLVIFINLVLFPLNMRINRAHQASRLAEMKVREGLEIQGQKEKIMQEYDKYEVYLRRQNRPSQEIRGDFLKELEEMIRASQLSVVSLSPASGSDAAGKSYRADLKAEGRMEEVIVFFDKIQKSGLLMKIDEFSLAPRDTKASVFKLDAKISMVVLE